MAQTTVNQYFVARKHSFSVQPTKKRKVDSSDIQGNNPVENKETVIKGKNKRSVRKRNPTRRIKEQTTTDNKGMVRITTKPSTPKKLIDCKIFSKSPVGKLEVNSTFNDQAKMILHSRGSSMLKASLKEKSLTSPAKASEVLIAISPQKNSDKLTFSIVGDVGRKLSSTKKDSNNDNITSRDQRKEALRKKYSSLLKFDEPVQPQLADDSSEKNDAPSDVSPPVNEKECRRQRMRDKYKHLLLKEENAANVVVEPTNITSPQKAHQKYRHLSEKAVTTKFQLPQKYKLLLEMFRSVDSILFLLQQRSEVCTFDRLKKSVESMCGREFGLNHLAAMKTVYSNGFIFRQEKGLYTSDGKTNNYQLTIEANFKDIQPNASLKNNSTVLISRRLKFENALLEITKQYHQKFLKKLNVKISDSEIHRWHPHFKVDDVPDITMATLPKAPITKSFSSAADILYRNPNQLSSKVENALAKASSTNQDDGQQQSEATKMTNSSTVTKPNNTAKNAKLKGVSSDLLERIRQKEKKKLELLMTRDPKQELRLSRLERLPEISRILKSYFTTEKKVAITVEDCVQKLSESYGTDVQTSKLEEHLHLLAELVPQWMQIIPVRKCMYVKLAKNYDINSVINTLTNVKKKEENS